MLNLAGQTALTPDLDTHCIWSKAWLYTFKPYQDALAHRSFFSHGPFVGIAGRVIYATIVISTAACILLTALSLVRHQAFDLSDHVATITTGLQGIYGAYTWREYLAIYVALDAGCQTHTVSDYVSTRWKKLRKDHSRPVATWKILTFTGHATSGFAWFEGAHYPNVGRSSKSKKRKHSKSRRVAAA